MVKSRIEKRKASSHPQGADFQLVTDCYQLKMKAHDGKMRDTDVANAEQILRLIQSITSPKAEPFKMWLATVGNVQDLPKKQHI